MTSCCTGAMRWPNPLSRRRSAAVSTTSSLTSTRTPIEILRALRPDGSGLTVVGDDAQSIYSFRAATIRNIVDFPRCFSPPATVIALERDYRSTQPILDAANAVIAGASEQIAKSLYSTKASAEPPFLANVEDEAAQARFVADSVLDHRENGTALRRQAVLFRTAHHRDRARPAEYSLCTTATPRDWPRNRAGPSCTAVGRSVCGGRACSVFTTGRCHRTWPGLCRVMSRLREANTAWQGQIRLVRDWCQPLLDRLYDYPASRTGDLDQLEQIAFGYGSRERFLTELTLDPPDASGAEAARPLLDEDYLILSTIHSAKGQEWNTVFILNLVDCIPSDMATGTPEQIDEERRLLYVAMTRAREHVHFVQPRRFYRTQQHRHGRGHVLAPRSRFLPDEILGLFTRVDGSPPSPTADGHPTRSTSRVDISIRLRETWR
jgi:DNA helicase-2/ATP-dependent DNA helicase PcrA